MDGCKAVCKALVLALLVAAGACSSDEGDGGGGSTDVSGLNGQSGQAGLNAGIGGTAGLPGGGAAGAIAGAAGIPMGGAAGVPVGGAAGVPAGGAAGVPVGGEAGVPTAGVAGPPAGTGGPPVGGMAGAIETGGTGGMVAGTGGSLGGTGGSPPPPGAGCTPAPSGSFQTTTMMGGPGGTYTIVRPTNLGEGGFLHPPLAWGNGLGTMPSLYAANLSDLASHGFVIIANPGPGSDPMVVRQGLEWLLEQNNSGEYAGKLAVDCAGTIGYSMGGGAAVGSGAHPAVKAIVSIHGLQDAADRASGPILLLTSEGDTFVTKSGFVEPCYNRSTVQPTILASHTGGDHIDPVLGRDDWDPAAAWLLYWIYGDQSQRDWFFGQSCRLCSWPDFRRKNGNWD